MASETFQSDPDESNWRCLFCKALNESGTASCSQCTKANTLVVNINQICFCGRNVTNHPGAVTQCKTCCKARDKKGKTCYWCNAKQCAFREITGSPFVVCNACHESTNSSTIDP
eukprot:79954_1